MDRIRVGNKGHNLLWKFTSTSTLALCRRAQVLIDSTISQPEPGDPSHCYTGVWIAGAAPGSIWGEEPKGENPPQQVQFPVHHGISTLHWPPTLPLLKQDCGAAERGLTLVLGTADSFDDVLRLC